MRFHIQFLNNQAIYQLHDDVLSFFQSAIPLARFNRNTLFTLPLRNIISDSRDLAVKFQRVFTELNRPGINKQAVYNSLVHNNDIIQLLTNREYLLVTLPEPLYDNLNNSIKTLYSFLWDSSIKTISCSDNYSSIQDHYVLLDQLNRERTRRICPFCGLEKLKNPKEKRNEYDHYLDKASYPYASINFLNLVPMCDTCNKRPNKGTQNIIINPETEQRRLAYNPFGNIETFSINLNCQNIFSVNEVWIAEAVSDNPNEGFDTWKSVFRIDTRYSNYLKDEYEFWLVNFAAYFTNNIPADLNDLRNRINTYYQFRLNCATEPGDFLEIRFWPYVVGLSDEDLLLFFQLLQQRNLVLNN